MIIHASPHEGADKTYNLADGTPFRVRDWWDRGNPGGSWTSGTTGNPAVANYVSHVILDQLPWDDEVVYGNDALTGRGLLAHVSELGELNPFHIRRARRMLKRIELDPEHWNQQDWISECGTKFCAAGFVADSAGYRIDPASAHVFIDADHLDGIFPLSAAGTLGLPVRDVATNLLGLQDHPRAALALFSGENTLDNLKQIVEDYARGRFDAHLWRARIFDSNDPDDDDYDDDRYEYHHYDHDGHDDYEHDYDDEEEYADA